MEAHSQANNSSEPRQVLEGQLREMYGRVVYSHKTHEKCADMNEEKRGKNRIEILVQHPEESVPVSVPYLLFEREVDVDDEDGNLKRCRIAVAFGLEKVQRERWRVKLLTKGQVCIYFPAEKEMSNLRFHLHAPFASTVARDSVRACEANDNLRDQLAILIAESMKAIRDQGLLNVGFLAVLPNAKDNIPPFYKPIMERLIEAFQNEELTPMKREAILPLMAFSETREDCPFLYPTAI